METKIFEFDTEDQKKLHSILWIPDVEPCAVLQIAHGMTEHIDRYEEMAKELTSHGIIVAGFDLRGHGRWDKENNCASFGKGGWNKTLTDIDGFGKYLREQYPDLPLTFMGFSLGSFLVRDYLQNYPCVASQVAITGCGDQPSALLSVLKMLVSVQIKIHGFDCSSRLVRKLSFEMYNKNFQPERTKYDWLCSDQEQVDLYMADSLCKKDISCGLFWQLLDAMQRTGQDTAYEKWNKDIPILLMSGSQDAVGDFGKGVARLKGKMKKGGLKHVTMKMLPNARHDFLHEYESKDAEKAFKIIEMFITD